MWLTLILLGQWFSSAVSAVTPGPSQLLDAQHPRVLLHGKLSYFRDSIWDMTFEQARAAYAEGRFVMLKGSAVTAGNLSEHAVWVHFSLTVPSNDSIQWWLLVAPEHIDRITVFQTIGEGDLIQQEGGRNLPFSQRGFPSPGHAFRLGPLPEGTRQVFLRMTSDAMVKIEPSLWQESYLIRYLTGVNTALGAYFGLAGLLWLMALTRALMYRNGWDLAYLGYLSGFEMFHFINSGLLEAWGLSADRNLRDLLLQMGILFTGVSFVALVRTLIVWPLRQARWHGRAWVAGLVLVMLWLVFFWCFRRPLFPEVNLLTGVGLLLVGTLAGGWGAVKNYPHARVMILCFLPFVLWIVFLVMTRYSDDISIGAWERQRVMMVTSIAHMFALWLLTFSKDARLHAAKLKLEGELAFLQSEMSNQSLFLGLLTHEMSRPLSRLTTLVDKPDEAMSVRTSFRSCLHDIGTEMNEIMETCLDRMRQASSQTLNRKSTDIRLLVQSIVSHYRQASSPKIVDQRTAGAAAKLLLRPQAGRNSGEQSAGKCPSAFAGEWLYPCERQKD